MKLLAIETTAAVASVALYADGEVRAVRRADSAKKHAETLLPAITAMLSEQNTALSEIDAFAVDIGPGSFTGVRIGVTVANALAYASCKPVITVNALKTLCAPFFDSGRPVLALIDARNGNAYAAVYCGDEEIMAPRAEAIDTILENIPADAIVVGDVMDDRFTVAEEYRLPDAGWLANAAARAADQTCTAAVPLYLRPSQAERMRREAGKK